MTNWKWIKRSNILLFLILLGPFLLFSQPLASNIDGKNDSCYRENTAFADGEVVTYILYYNWNFIWIPAGEVVFSVNSDDSDWHFNAKGYTYPSYEWFYKVDDVYNSYVDKSNLQPKFFERDIHEGDYKFYNSVEFDTENGKVISHVGKSKDKLKRQEKEFTNCVQDILSLVYNTRNIDIEGIMPGDEIPVNMFIDHDKYDIGIEYQGIVKSKKIKGQGKFDVIHISPELIAGNIFSEDQRMNIWVSNDKNRLPLLIESPISVGSVKVVLKEYSGLRHPLMSRRID